MNRPYSPPFGSAFTSFPGLEDFIYFPWTDWHNFWRQWFCPQFNFGCNVDDRDVEHHVLDTVGSYGSQLNKIIDALSVVVSHMQSGELKLTAPENEDLKRFEILAKAASKASTVFEDRQADATVAKFRAMAHELKKMKDRNPGSFAKIQTLFHEIQGTIGR
ncbi:conserved protein of unknown function [Rhodovastum atsumiense]|uniref:Uncharacterized protein n=1 Tax=Rhodovastum atsumiense TaxID=504468 RepID=A0A5M6IS93_9PROT|nr:hypothetical protein [Rhodovastum atsumiense]KAA5611176.1 hypothetical protein F1189_15515 [Rhodovastum atsumiense]CAH2602517.1 conserved protein of unknown function [Rhodovastum atsumiense]